MCRHQFTLVSKIILAIRVSDKDRNETKRTMCPSPTGSIGRVSGSRVGKALTQLTGNSHSRSHIMYTELHQFVLPVASWLPLLINHFPHTPQGQGPQHSEVKAKAFSRNRKGPIYSQSIALFSPEHHMVHAEFSEFIEK